MHKALLATKIEKYNNQYKDLSIGDITSYETKRKAIVNKLVIDDLIYLRIQGSGDVLQIYKFISLNTSSPRRIIMKLAEIVEFSTKEIFEIYGVKAGAEHGWLNE